MANQERDDHGRWQPGTSGNPGGRPKSKACLTDCLRRLADREIRLADGGTVTYAQALAARVWRLALDGERWACELLYTRLDGRPAWTVDAPWLEEDEPRLVVLPFAAPARLMQPQREEKSDGDSDS